MAPYQLSDTRRHGEWHGFLPDHDHRAFALFLSSARPAMLAVYMSCTMPIAAGREPLGAATSHHFPPHYRGLGNCHSGKGPQASHAPTGTHALAHAGVAIQKGEVHVPWSKSRGRQGSDTLSQHQAVAAAASTSAKPAPQVQPIPCKGTQKNSSQCSLPSIDYTLHQRWSPERCQAARTPSQPEMSRASDVLDCQANVVLPCCGSTPGWLEACCSAACVEGALAR